MEDLSRVSAINDSQMQFSLFYFANNELQSNNEDKYRLVTEGAKFADQHGFTAVWTPERHFNPFGGLYPNPSVMSAALAMITDRIQLRAGSVVAPLHHPIRIAEEWSLVDNLSKGRLGIAFASGWHANDFVFFPENYSNRHEVMFRGIELIRRLWRGEAVRVRGGGGNELDVRIFPQPVQPELPIWVTAAGRIETFVQAGELGANLLTYLSSQSVEQAGEKISAYRGALARHGYDSLSRTVTLMLHTYIGDDLQSVRETTHDPFCNYIRSFTGLLDELVGSVVELLRDRIGSLDADRVAFTLLRSDGTAEADLTYMALDTRARALAARLQSLGLTGQRALLVYPQGLEFITAFYSCLYAGVAPVPALAPSSNRATDRLNRLGAAECSCERLFENSILGSLRRNEDEEISLMTTLGRLYASGHAVNWPGLYPAGAFVDLPRYSWQRERFWLDAPKGMTDPVSFFFAGQRRKDGLPLLGRKSSTPLRQQIFETRFSARAPSFLQDHQLKGVLIAPAMAYIEMIFEAASQAGGDPPYLIEDFSIIEPLILTQAGARVVQTVLKTEPSGQFSFQIFSRNADDDSDGSWSLHASGRAGKAAAATKQDAPKESLEALKELCAQEVGIEFYYGLLRDRGFEYGPTFRGVNKLWRGDQAALGRVDVPPSTASGCAYLIHPGVLEACLQVVGALADQVEVSQGHIYMPFGIESLRFNGFSGSTLWSYASVQPLGRKNAEIIKTDLCIFDNAGAEVAEIIGLQFKRANLLGATQQVSDWFYEVGWEPDDQ